MLIILNFQEAQLVDVVTLSKMIRKEIMKLAKKFPLGVQGTLRYNVEKWQKQIQT